MQRDDDDAALAQREQRVRAVRCWLGREARRECAGPPAGLAWCVPGEARLPATLRHRPRPRCPPRSDHFGFGGGALEAALGVDVRGDGFFVDEFQARVHFRRTRQGPGDLPQEQLQDRQEPLQVGLLVDREFDVAFVEQFLGFFGQVEAAGLDAFGGEPELLHHARQFRGVAAVDGVHPLRVRMAGPVGFDGRFLTRFQRAGHDRGQFDWRARCLDRDFSSFEARLQVRRARVGGEDDHVARAHRGDDPLAHEFAGQFQVLAYVGQALVGGRGGVGVVGDRPGCPPSARFRWAR